MTLVDHQNTERALFNPAFYVLLHPLLTLKNFALGLRRDYDAVKAALTYEWGAGQTEGQINQLKLLKREAYGRAKFDLLRRRVLGMPVAA